MKYLFLFLFLAACASKNPDWDSGAEKQQTFKDERREEQTKNTRDQNTTPGLSF